MKEKAIRGYDAPKRRIKCVICGRFFVTVNRVRKKCLECYPSKAVIQDDK